MESINAYIAYAKKCNVPNTVSMLERVAPPIKVAEQKEETPVEKVASLEEKIVDIMIEKYAGEPKENVLELAKELGKILDEKDKETLDALNAPENLEQLKELI